MVDLNEIHIICSCPMFCEAWHCTNLYSSFFYSNVNMLISCQVNIWLFQVYLYLVNTDIYTVYIYSKFPKICTFFLWKLLNDLHIFRNWQMWLFFKPVSNFSWYIFLNHIFVTFAGLFPAESDTWCVVLATERREIIWHLRHFYVSLSHICTFTH